jgi:hypothetical protein
MGNWRTGGLAFLLVVMSGGAAWAQVTPASPTLTGNIPWAETGEALLKLFVIALLLESALAVIFNWRVFLTYFTLRGWRTIIMVGVALLIVTQLDLDIFRDLVAAYTNVTVTNPDFGTQFITALIIAGGSVGVNNLLVALGYRDKNKAEEVIPKPKEDRAWVAVEVKRDKAVGAVRVLIAEVANVPAVPIAGTALAKRPGLLSLLFLGTNRFPRSGGYEVKPYTAYKIQVEGRDVDGNALTADVTAAPVAFAPRAIVDFEVRL